MEEGIGWLIGIGVLIWLIGAVLWLISAAVWSIAYLIYVMILWIINFIYLYRIFFYGFGLVLVILTILWFSESTRLEKDNAQKEWSHKLLKENIFKVRDHLSRNWKN